MGRYHTGPRPPAPPGPLASADVDSFIERCFTDSRGAPVRQAAVHRELQAHLAQHPKALVEMPRDHGKSFQVC